MGLRSFLIIIIITGVKHLMIGITITLINIIGMLNISTNGLLPTLLAFHNSS